MTKGSWNLIDRVEVIFDKDIPLLELSEFFYLKPELSTSLPPTTANPLNRRCIPAASASLRCLPT